MASSKSYSSRLLIVGITVAIILLYIGRLFYLQVLTSNYKERADNNAFYQKPIYPARGVIYDRNGSLLVYNKPTYDLMVTMREVEEIDTLDLCRILNIDPALLSKRLTDIQNRRLNPGYSPFVPQVLISQIDAPEAGRFQEKLYKYPGFYIRSRTLREYEYHHAGHLLGYLSEANPKDLERDSSLVAGDYVGKTGVEKSYEQTLRGEKGVMILLRDARGRIKGRYQNGHHDRAPIPGSDITLSIDKDLQAFGEKLMQGKRGAIVAIEPETGEVLCMVSAPSYDPASLGGKDRGTNHRLMEADPGKPLYARAIMGVYPPGSTFKPTQGAIFLSERVLSSATMLSCHHGFPPLRNRPACHGHASPISLVPALATSCNAFFCWGLRFMLDNRQYYSSVQQAFEKWKGHIVNMGFGYKLDVDLPNERRGYIPNSKVYDKVYRGSWNSSSIISIAIGQGEILATPLQLANLSALIANRGYYYKPHVVRSVSKLTIDNRYKQRQESKISPLIWEEIVQGMAMAVTSGTCHAANFAPGEIIVCGKTGTAENPHGKDHSAFIGFAPKDHPKIAVAVYVENGGFGARFGVPIGRLIMEYYLRKGELSSGGKELANQFRQLKIAYPDESYRRPTFKTDAASAEPTVPADSAQITRP